MRALTVAAVVLLIAGCGDSGPGATGRRGDVASRAHAAETASTTDTSPAAGAPPAADAPLPRSAPAIAAALSNATRDLEAEVRRWLRANPAAAARPPAPVTLYALYQQRIYRRLRLHPTLAERVIAAMPPRRRAQARDNVAAGRSLFLLAPKKPPKIQPPVRTGPAEPPGRLLGWYREAQRRFGIRWQMLAAINFVESGFGRMRNHSYAGAQGPMQFIPATWRTYGLGGDVRDPHDAILGAANYLHASGAPANYRRALYSYNPSALYVDAITRYARQMQRRPERYYGYWSWQVFVRTKQGQDKRLTGPRL